MVLCSFHRTAPSVLLRRTGIRRYIFSDFLVEFREFDLARTRVEALDARESSFVQSSLGKQATACGITCSNPDYE
jgi:hypothetical protein